MKAAPRPNVPQRQASDPRHSAWVNANAGSGKTHVLVDRVIRLLLRGTPPARILCLTFTKAAASEMSGRILKRLAGWVAMGDGELAKELELLGSTNVDDDLLLSARRLFAATQETPGGLKIQTIHAFCERLLHLFPVEAGMSPGFSVLDDLTATALRAACRDQAINAALNGSNSSLKNAVAFVAPAVTMEAFDELVQSSEDWLARDGRTLPSDSLAEGLSNALGLGSVENWDRTPPEIDIEKYRELHAAMRTGSEKDLKAAEQLRAMLAESSANLTDVRPFLLTARGEPKSTKVFPTKKIRDEFPWAAPFIIAEQDRLTGYLDRMSDMVRIEGTQALITIVSDIVARYEQAKRQRGQYDFDDLVSRTRSLLDDKPDAAWVLYKLDGGIDHILVDEAQDTSPAQWEIVKSLTEEFFSGQGSRAGLLRTIFAVGDRKQSIFSFQGADPAAFEGARTHFSGRLSGLGNRLVDVNLSISFRSAPEVLGVVDAVFTRGQPALSGLETDSGDGDTHQSNRLKERGLVEVWPLIKPEEQDKPDPWTAPVDRLSENAPARKLARKIAATVKSWIGRRAIGGSDRPVNPGDILILVRRRNVFFDAMISELRQHGIPVSGADRLKLKESLAVLDLVELANFTVVPENDLSLACVLKSPLVASPLTEDELFDLCQQRAGDSVWHRLKASASEKHQRVVSEIETWMTVASTRPPFEFFASVIQARRLAIVSRLGNEANDALDAFLQAAIDHGTRCVSTLSSFLTWFSGSDIEIKRDMELAAGEVRVMTVHGAKGLEAPIVILPDTTSLPNTSSSGGQLLSVPTASGSATLPLWAMPGLRKTRTFEQLKQQANSVARQEYHRLLYVAMTRARDELYVCGYHGKRESPAGNWHQLVLDALSRMPGARKLEDGAWRYGDDAGQAGAMGRAPADKVALPPWISTPAPREPGDVRLAVTGLAKVEGEQPAVDTAALLRGRTVHRLLMLLPDAPETARQDLALRIVRRAGQPDALAAEVLNLMSNPVLEPILAPEALAEVALSAPLPALGREVSGRIDRLVVTDKQITIVDYKSDTFVPEATADIPVSYARQMALYREVMRNAYPGRRIVTVLVWTALPLLMELPEALLDQTLARLMAART